MSEGLFLDTSFVQAMLNRRDQYHSRAVTLAARLRHERVLTTEAVITEIGNALSSSDRAKAAAFIRGLYTTPNATVVTVTTSLLQQALSLYESRLDKGWGLTDCISFIVMERESLRYALSSDRDFYQAGFVPLLLDQA
jgi:predicted nucleic acid-binding protein